MNKNVVEIPHAGTCTITAPKKLYGQYVLPASKSISNRALIINALSGSENTLSNLSICDDTDVIVSAFLSDLKQVDVKAAGTAMRFMTAYLSITPGKHLITGTARMCERPIKILVDALTQLGAKIRYVDKPGYPPLEIEGTELTGSIVGISGQVSSQYISALMMIAPMLKKGLNLHLLGKVVSMPYILMTADLMRHFGAVVEHPEAQTLHIAPTGYTSCPYLIESDWSAASYWYEMMALTSDKDAVIRLPNLHAISLQGDAKIIDIFTKLGVKSEQDGDTMILSKIEEKVSFMDANLLDIPDMAQTLVVTCCLLDIPFCFTGLQSLKIKETDRIEALIKELSKLGYEVGQKDNSELYWAGGHCEQVEDPIIETYHDHRMAMAFAPIAMRRGTIKIANMEVVSKSYPQYWEHLATLGFNIKG